MHHVCTLDILAFQRESQNHLFSTWARPWTLGVLRDGGHLESFSGKSVVNSPHVNLLVLKRPSASPTGRALC